MFNVKLAATLMVALMMFSGAAVMVGTEDNALDAVVGDGGAYSYTLTYHSDQMGNTAAQELQLTVDGMTPISHASGTTTLSSLANEGSWGFNTTTGIGPFNSFYAAFDMTDGNKFVSILNPYDLTKKIDGTSLGDMSNYNIMWVLPTVYWSVDNNGNLTLTNDPTGGTAYAHTINGHVYNYMALGVYEGYLKTISGTQYLTSQSGVSASANQTIPTLRDKANNYTMDSSLGTNAHSMLWNFYMYELYKYCSYTVMEGFNSQSFVGNGYVYGSTSSFTTGSLNTNGPYAGNPGSMGGATSFQNYGSDPVKLFLENAWGGAKDWVDGIIVTNNTLLYLDTSSAPSGSTTSGDYIEEFSCTIPSGYANEIRGDAKLWGIGTNTAGSYSIGLTDYSFSNTSAQANIVVGGNAGTEISTAWGYGIGCIEYKGATTSSNSGSRLAFVMDNVFPTATVTVTPNDSDYGTVSPASITDIEPGDTIIVANNTITYGETVVTATPAEADAQYTYAFSGFVDSNSDPLTGTVTVNSDMTITAVFTATTNQYAVTISPNDPSYGSVSPSSLTVDYGTAITVSGTSLTIGSQAITATASDATAQYTYAFDSWTVPGAVETVTGPITITGTFTATVNEYTITIESADVTLGTVDVSEVQDVPYGTAITVDGDTITIGDTTITATVIGDGLVTKWSVSDGATVTGDMTITASFVEPSSIENTLMGMLPLLLIIVLVITAAGGVFASGGDPESLIKLVICLAVGVIIISVFVLPIAGGL